MRTCRPLLGTLLFASLSSAHAGVIHRWSVDDLPSHGRGINSNGGHIRSIDSTYDVDAERFSWEYTVSDANDGFWLVVSDGEDPKGDRNEYAILYGDLPNDRITAYVYNGQNNSNSIYDRDMLLGTFDHAFDVRPGPSGSATKTVSFSLDVARINADDSRIPAPKDWDGVGFGDEIGVWFHATRGSSFGYREDGSVLSYGHTGAGWFDRAELETNRVPEPATLAMLGLGGVLLARTRRPRAMKPVLA